VADPGRTGAADLLPALRDLGVTDGATLLVHAALGGTGLAAEDLRDALLTALGPTGTLVVPAFTEGNSDTSHAYRAAVRGMTPAEAARHRDAMPAFDARTTPGQHMGRFAETVRTTPGAVRSAHPQTSFAAVGHRAAELLAAHPLTSHLGWESPAGALHRAGGRVLMINIGFQVCSVFHLAEYRPDAPRRFYSCVVRSPGGGKKWERYQDVELDDSDFALIGADFPWGTVREGRLGEGTARLFSIKDAVHHAERWMSEKRP
jgi:aminoglycoside 3-N-acetyltransferase